MSRKDLQAKKLVLEHLKLAKVLAARFCRDRSYLGLDVEELEAEAYVGLCEAAKRFDHRRGYSFKTFCYTRIIGAMIDYLRREGSISRGLLGGQEAGRKRRSHRAHYPFGIASTAAELERLNNVIDICGLRVHLNKETVELAYAEALSPEQQSVRSSVKRRVAELLRTAPGKERKILHLYYYRALSFEEMRRYFGGASKSWICRLHRRALERLRAKTAAANRRCEQLLKAAA